VAGRHHALRVTPAMLRLTRIKKPVVQVTCCDGCHVELLYACYACYACLLKGKCCL